MLIDLPTAKLHVAADGDADAALITLYLGAAERSVVEYACRNIYATQGALDAAIAAVPDALIAAKTAYDAAIVLADAMDAGDLQDMAVLAADEAYTKAKQSARMTYQGIVVNDQIKAAILLTLGHLYANRENSIVGVQVAALPMGSQYLMNSFRAY
jgi:hypothetical protein